MYPCSGDTYCLPPSRLRQWKLTKARWMPLFSYYAWSPLMAHPFQRLFNLRWDRWTLDSDTQGEMVDDWWQPAPGKIAAPPTLRWESGGKSAAIFLVNTAYAYKNWTKVQPYTIFSSGKTNFPDFFWLLWPVGTLRFLDVCRPGCPLNLVKQIPWFFPDSFPIFQDMTMFKRLQSLTYINSSDGFHKKR